MTDSSFKNHRQVTILFGGPSEEHEVSITSAFSVAQVLDRALYSVEMVGIDRQGRWFWPRSEEIQPYLTHPRDFPISKCHRALGGLGMPFTDPPLKADIILPILHGTGGEDGAIQGLLELGGVPYLGSGVLGSAVGMDKDLAKRVFSQAGIPVVPWTILRRGWPSQKIQETLRAFSSSIGGGDLFVKPANAGSSVGVYKLKSNSPLDWEAKITLAFQHDTKVLIEKAIEARELEVSVLGLPGEEIRASIIGEIVPNRSHEFYSYEAKYLDENGARLLIPADPQGLSSEAQSLIRNYAIMAFESIEARGLSRVDFFLDRPSGKIYLNEINTLPGFTSISMYPKLWEASGLSYRSLLNELIRISLSTFSPGPQASRTSSHQTSTTSTVSLNPSLWKNSI